MFILIKLLNKLNQAIKNKKQIIELIIFKKKQLKFIKKILYLLYHYGFIQNYCFIFFKSIYILQVFLFPLNKYNFKITSKISKLLSVKKYNINHYFNTYQNLFFTNTLGLNIYPFHKQSFGILLFKIK